MASNKWEDKREIMGLKSELYINEKLIHIPLLEDTRPFESALNPSPVVDTVKIEDDASAYWFDIRKGRTKYTDAFERSFGKQLASGRKGTGSKGRRAALHSWVRNLMDYQKQVMRQGYLDSGVLVRTDSKYFKEVKSRASIEHKDRIRTRNAIDIILRRLLSDGWIEVSRKGSKKSKKVGAYKPTQQFFEWMEEVTSNSIDVSTPFYTRSNEDSYLEDGSEYVLDRVSLTSKLKLDGGVKESIKHNIEDSHPIVVETKSLLNKFNSFNILFDWKLYENNAYDLGEVSEDKQWSTIFKHKLTYSRSFSRGDTPNHNYGLGGRFHNGLSLTAPKRDLICVGDEPTVEIDFNALHVRLAYADKGISVSFKDGYDLGHADLNNKYGRTVIKNVFITLFNIDGLTQYKSGKLRPKTDKELAREVQSTLCGSNAAYIKSIPLLKKANLRIEQKAIHLNDFNQVQEAIKVLETKTSESIEKERVLECINDIRKVHAPIKEYFHSDFGIRAQNTDSKIIMRAMELAMESNMPMLIYHDSIRVPESMYSKACEILKRAFKEVVGNEIPDEALKANWSVLSKINSRISKSS